MNFKKGINCDIGDFVEAYVCELRICDTSIARTTGFIGPCEGYVYASLVDLVGHFLTYKIAFLVCYQSVPKYNDHLYINI